MPRYEYFAIDAEGRRMTGEITAASHDEAERELAARGLRVEQLEPTDLMSPATGSGLESEIELSESDLIGVTSQVADLTQAGLPLASGLRALSEELPAVSVGTRQALAELSRRLEAGEPLDKAIAGMGDRVPPHLAGLVEVGLQAGNPGLLLQHYLNYTRTAIDLRRRVWLGLAYPLILIGVAVSIIAFIAILIVPQFRSIFEDFEVELPGLTVAVFQASDVIAKFWLVLLVGIPALVGLVLVTLTAIGGRPLIRQSCYIIPLVGPLMRYSSLARFCHLLALMVESRIQLPTALRMAGEGTEDSLLSAGAMDLASEIEQGAAPEDALEQVGRLPMDLGAVFRWSRKPGLFGEALHAAGEIYAARARVQAGLIATILQPVILLGIASAVAGIVIGLFLPLFKLLNDLS